MWKPTSRLKLFIDNWRWSGVPFYLRTGKYLPHERQRGAHPISSHAARPVRRAMRAEPRRQCPHAAPPAERGDLSAVQRQGARHEPGRAARCGCISATTPNSALTRPKLTNGCCWKPSPATRRSSSAATRWRPRGRIVDSIRQGWDGKPLTNREFYAAGTWGPVAADEMLAGRNHKWRMTSDVSAAPKAG